MGNRLSDISIFPPEAVPGCSGATLSPPHAPLDEVLLPVTRLKDQVSLGRAGLSLLGALGSVCVNGGGRCWRL